MAEINRILFITLSNIGDAVLTTPAMRIVSEKFPNAGMDVMAGPAAVELFEDHPAVSGVISYDKHARLKDKKALVKKLRKAGYDLVVDMRNSLFPFLLGARFKTNPLYRPPKALRHKKQQHIRKLSSAGLGFSAEDARFYIHVPKEDGDYIDKIVPNIKKTAPVVAVSPGAKSDIKRWPAENFVLLAKKLAGGSGARIILVGDDRDSGLTKKIAASIGDSVTDLSGKTTLCQLGALLKRCNLLITNDSAPLHIAGAMGTDVLAIFGPTDPESYGPTGKNDRVVRKKLKCSPCRKAQCKYEHECMKDLGVDEVFEAAKEMLGR